MKNKKIFLNIITILIILLLITIISILLIVSQKIKNNLPDEELIVEIELDKELERVSSRNNFYIVKRCISKFYTYSVSLYNEENIEDSKEALLSMLDEEYISYNNITKDNITTFLPSMNKIQINIEDMYVSQKTENTYIYLVYGDLINTSNFQVEEFSMIVKVDMINRTYTLLLKDYVSAKYPNMQGGEYIEISCPKSIEANDYNMYTYESISEETYIGDVFNIFRNNMLFNREAAYKNLDEEYRNKRFPKFEDFDEYIKDNVRNIIIAELIKYQKNTNEDGSSRYICEDKNGNYYIIDEISTMNCTFILDTYTLDLPEFITKYNESDAYKKVALNIEKIREAINFKDYEYVYNKTNNTFKNNKFKNFEEFENYLKTNLFEENIFNYKNIEYEANVYIAEVKITNKKKSSDKEKELKVIMRLSEDSIDYEISFEFEE